MSSDHIKSKIVLYKSLQPCICPAIGEVVHFTSDGLQHLLYKKRRPRNKKEQNYRMGLVDFLVPVVTGATAATKIIKANNPKLVVHWVLEYEIQQKTCKRLIKVILMREGSGKLKFLSVMQKRYYKKHQGNS